jgi:hypothetical protein
MIIIKPMEVIPKAPIKPISEGINCKNKISVEKFC